MQNKNNISQSARAVEYTDCPTEQVSWIWQSDGEIPVMLELWEMWSTPSLPSLPGPL